MSRLWPRPSRRALHPVAMCLAWSVAAVAPSAASADIVSARYDAPTMRYPHGVLGDDVEHAALVVKRSSGAETRLLWPDTIVFEDTSPRVVDLDGDGASEVIVVESHERQGARLAIYGLVDDQLALRAATPFIGTRFRWLAVVGAADFDGDGVTEIAYVDRPHLAKTLRVWRYETDGDQATLTQVGALPGVTNHRIGEVDIAGGVRTCAAGPEMVVATANWQDVVAVRFDGVRFETTRIGPHSNRADFASALSCGEQG